MTRSFSVVDRDFKLDKFLQVDLNGDGIITEMELTVYGRTQAKAERGPERILNAHDVFC